MNKRHLSAVPILTVVVLLAIITTGASARNLEIIRFERGFKITWRPLRLEAGGNTIECPVTLEGNFERATYTKIPGGRIGRVTGASFGTCERGHATALRETLPWEVTFNNFAGRLPTITSITWNFLRFSWQLEISGIACLARTEISRPIRGIATVEAGGNITGFRADETARIETTGGFFCSFGGPANFAGTANSIFERSGTGVIGIRLI